MQWKLESMESCPGVCLNMASLRWYLGHVGSDPWQCSWWFCVTWQKFVETHRTTQRLQWGFRIQMIQSELCMSKQRNQGRQVCGVEESPFLLEPTFTSTTWTERHTPFAVNRVIVTCSGGWVFCASFAYRSLRATPLKDFRTMSTMLSWIPHILMSETWWSWRNEKCFRFVRVCEKSFVLNGICLFHVQRVQRVQGSVLSRLKGEDTVAQNFNSFGLLDENVSRQNIWDLRVWDKPI